MFHFYYCTLYASLVLAAMALPQAGQSPLGLEKQDIRTPVPGDSPAYFIGDPSDDLLQITKLHLIVNPPERLGFITVALWGRLTAAPGPDPRYKLMLSRNGTRWGGDIHGDLFNLADMKQGELPASPKLYPGPIEMISTIPSPGIFYQKGDYTARVLLSTGKGKRMTEFEGTIYIDGLDEDYRGEDVL